MSEARQDSEETHAIDRDTRLLGQLLAAAQVVPPADPFNSDLSQTDALVELLKRESVRGTLFRLRDQLLPTEDERRQVSEAADPMVRWCWSDLLSWGYVWWDTMGQTREDYLRKRERLMILLRALRDRLPARSAMDIDGAPVDMRISPKQAMERGVPELGLPPTPRSTLYDWMSMEKSARILAIDWRAKRAAQRLSVRGLLQLHGAKQRRTPPHGSDAR